MRNFLLGRLRSIKFAIKGMFLLVRTEHAIIAQISIGILMTIVGFCVGISKIEWIFQTLCIGLVLTAEGLNTAIEAICDFIHPNYHKKIGTIKDISAGAVTLAAFTAILIAGIIYFPYIFN